MKKPKGNKFGIILYIIIFLLGWLFSQFILTPFLYAEDSKEVLILKQQILSERIMRIQTQLQLLQRQFKDGQELLKTTQQEFEAVTNQLKALEPKKEEPEPEKKK